MFFSITGNCYFKEHCEVTFWCLEISHKVFNIQSLTEWMVLTTKEGHRLQITSIKWSNVPWSTEKSAIGIIQHYVAVPQEIWTQGGLKMNCIAKDSLSSSKEDQWTMAHMQLLSAVPRHRYSRETLHAPEHMTRTLTSIRRPLITSQNVKLQRDGINLQSR